MNEFMRNLLEKDVKLDGITDMELKIALDELGRDFVYNYLLLGQDVTYEIFVEELKRYLELKKHL